MRNYIILNGRKSTEITGLLISNLPAITKPRMRTEIVEIDGRDGDIVNKLGYQSYDKEFDIGLYGDYDIDAVIGFFATEGIVTFSNEITKYYRYQIIEQIDFERLGRFKTAKVKMHIQPFKYSTIEEARNLIVTDNMLAFSNGAHLDYNGIDIRHTTDGSISISGTTEEVIEYTIPIQQLRLALGSYTFSAFAVGTNPQAVKLRLIDGSPTRSFAGTYLRLAQSETTSISETILDTASYNLLYIFIPAGKIVNTVIYPKLTSGQHAFTILNNGNITAKPKMTIHGEGNIKIGLNGRNIFDIALGDEEYIEIDTEEMEAKKWYSLKNRLVTGDYSKFALNPGANTISWEGKVTQILLVNYSRWL